MQKRVQGNTEVLNEGTGRCLCRPASKDWVYPGQWFRDASAGIDRTHSIQLLAVANP